jgi:hypothetical protein
MDKRSARLAQNEAVFRLGNELIDAAVAGKGATGAPLRGSTAI